jgi:hypothetical protein
MRKAVCISILIIVMLWPVSVMSQTGVDPCGDATDDAMTDFKYWEWIAIGCAFNVFGVAAAYFFKPQIPPSRFLGKTPEYVGEYTDCYLRLTRRFRSNKAWIGCGVAGGTALAILIIVAAAASSAEPSCTWSPSCPTPTCSSASCSRG